MRSIPPAPGPRTLAELLKIIIAFLFRAQVGTPLLTGAAVQSWHLYRYSHGHTYSCKMAQKEPTSRMHYPYLPTQNVTI